MKKARGFVLALLAALAVGLTLAALRRGPAPMNPIAGLGGSFTLTDQNGARVTEASFLGKPTLYFFGFTHCPDVCPTTLYEMTTQKQKLGAHAETLQIIFISVDPQRDTAQVLRDYLQPFPGVTGLTGTAEEVDKAVKAFHVYAKKMPLVGDDYTMDHTASVFAADTKGRVLMTIGYGEAPDMVRAKLERLLRQ